jgi:signal-transduction protein with cAMP-binding, CBS, and nucleotidyltransferase domain
MSTVTTLYLSGRKEARPRCKSFVTIFEGSEAGRDAYNGTVGREGLDGGVRMSEFSFLKKVVLFKQFDEAELLRIDGVLVRTTFEPGELILGEGQPNRALHVVRDGRVRVSRAAEEADVILSDLPPGRTFGELSILDDGTASATLRALPRTVILSVSFVELNRILEESPVTAAKFWRAIALDLRARLLQTNEVVQTYFAVNRNLVENPRFREAYAMMAR